MALSVSFAGGGNLAIIYNYDRVQCGVVTGIYVHKVGAAAGVHVRRGLIIITLPTTHSDFYTSVLFILFLVTIFYIYNILYSVLKLFREFFYNTLSRCFRKKNTSLGRCSNIIHITTVD